MTRQSTFRDRVSATLMGLLLCAFGAQPVLADDLIAPDLNASNDDPGMPQGIALVLGGGGARGAAHIGILKVLERERIPVDAIAGTSMGSVVGGLYAAGYDAEEIEAILGQLDWKDLFEDDPARIERPMRRKQDEYRYLLGLKLGLRDGRIQLPRGLLQGQKLLMMLRRLLLPVWETEEFDQLSIPFRCVGTDIGSGQPVVFDGGDLALAIRSSMSVPAAIAPIRVNGKLMVDGGIVDQVPIDVVRHISSAPIIAVDVSEPLLPESNLDSPVSVTLQMITVLMQRQTEAQLASLGEQDTLIVPDLGGASSTDFLRAAELVKFGEIAADENIERLRRYAVSEADYAAWQEKRRARRFDPPLIAFLEVVTRRSSTAGYVRDQLSGLVGQPLDTSDIEADIGRAFGYDNYERIDWRPERRKDGVGLLVTPVDKGWGPNYLDFGLALSDNFNGGSSFQLTGELTMTGLNRYGGEWRNRLDLGRATGLRSEYFQPWGENGQFYLQPYAQTRSLSQPLRFDNRAFATYRVRRDNLGTELGVDISPKLRLYTALEYGRESARLSIGDDILLPERISDNYGLWRGGVIRDSLDSASFPSRGSRFALQGELYRQALGSDSDGESLDLVWDKALSRGASNYLFSTRLHSSWGEPGLLQEGNLLGGFTRLSGYGDRELYGDQSALFRSVYYRRFGNAEELFSVPAYLGVSLESGAVWQSRGEVSADSLIYAGSVFLGVDTFFGPIFLGYGHADTGASSWYLSFGSLLQPRN